MNKYGYGELGFNPEESKIMHIDLNSCFTSVEQQANPLIRGKPVVVAAYASPGGCILASSVEAKKLGIKTGFRVRDAQKICPSVIVLPPDPWKYRNVHLSLRKIISYYTYNFCPKSIDEFTLDFTDIPLKSYPHNSPPIHMVAREIKKRIKEEVGDWLTVSVGIATNRFLAKTASNLHKPDGLDEINIKNFMDTYKNLGLTDLGGIKIRNSIRLASFDIRSVLDFYNADIRKLKAAFHSIGGYYWYLRLRGWEIDDTEFGRSSYGNSYALPKPFSDPSDLAPIISKLTEKMGFRLRNAGYRARGIHVAVSYRSGKFWHKGIMMDRYLYDSRDLFKEIYKIFLFNHPKEAVREIAVSTFGISKIKEIQLNMFEDMEKKNKLVASIDKINDRWGEFIVTSGRMLGTKEFVHDRIAFGGVKELEEFTLG